MTIFSRRSIQQMLDALAGSLTDAQLAGLAAKLNADDPSSLAAEWEVAVLAGLARSAQLYHERPLGGASRVDVFVELDDDPAIQCAADIRCISDRGLQNNSPIDELMRLVAARAQKLGIKPGGFDHRVTRRVGTAKVRLKMPDKGQLYQFFQTSIAPQMRAIVAAPDKPWSLEIRDDISDIRISYTPGTRYSSAGYPAFRHPTVIDSNPLFQALKRKREQLRDAGYDGPKGIIICDGGCETLTRKAVSWDSFSKAQIVRKFFDGTSGISFVLLLWVEDPHRRPGEPSACRTLGELYLNPKAAAPLPQQLQDLFRRLPEAWPPPIQNGENARLELEGVGHKRAQPFWGHKLGDLRTSSGPNGCSIRLSARSLLEILAGHTTPAEFAAGYGLAATANPFSAALARGFTVSAVSLEKKSDVDDDWIEFRLSGPDAAIAPFKAPTSAKKPPP